MHKAFSLLPTKKKKLPHY